MIRLSESPGNYVDALYDHIEQAFNVKRANGVRCPNMQGKQFASAFAELQKVFGELEENDRQAAIAVFYNELMTLTAVSLLHANILVLKAASGRERPT